MMPNKTVLSVVNNFIRATYITAIITLTAHFSSHAQTADKSALDRLVAKAKETHSAAMVVYIDGKLVLNETFEGKGEPMDAMSATKSVVNLAIGKLITDKKLVSIDEPVYKFFPEWNQGMKKEITIRHLLNHTSGLQSLRTTAEIYPSPDFVQLALSAELSDKPGTKFFYNNKAVNLLAAIVQKVSGKRMDKYIKEEIFNPIGISNSFWLTDAFLYHLNTAGKQDTAYLSKGNPIVMAELFISAEEMAKIGLFCLNKGAWNGKQIIAESWFAGSMKPGQPYDPTCGLLWWLIYNPETSYITFGDTEILKLKKARLNDKLLGDLKKVKGRYKSSNDLMTKVDTLPSIKKLGGRLAFRLHLFDLGFNGNIYKPHYGYQVGYMALGTYGQYITVFPDKKIVAVRTISNESYTGSNDEFQDFNRMVYELVK